jgi:putative DNA modification/repair radical SAM protein
MEKLTILTEGAKYDVACTSSGVDRPGNKGLGSTLAAGCCHAFAADGRCISLLKVLMSNACVYDCQYCVNRCSNDVPRATFAPEELAELTIQFYRRNYIEGLFLSSGVIKDPDYTTERMIRALEILRQDFGFNGYIHAKAIPGTSGELIHRLGMVVDRLSVNIELPSEGSLRVLAPDKTKEGILTPMGRIRDGLLENKADIVRYGRAPSFAAAGQATQMIIGATPETDYRIITLASSLYSHYDMRRVFYSAYVPVAENSLLPAIDTKPPLMREHRLYQADFLMRQYHFDADEILSEETPNFNPYLDPKCNWAVHNMWFFPVDVNAADKEDLLRVPGIGPLSAKRIVVARRTGKLGMAELKKIGVVLKRAQYFIITSEYPAGTRISKETTLRALIDPGVYALGQEQLSLFGPPKTALENLGLLEYGFEPEGQASEAAFDRQKSAESERNTDTSCMGVSATASGTTGSSKGSQKRIKTVLPLGGDVSSATEGVEEAILFLARQV